MLGIHRHRWRTNAHSLTHHPTRGVVYTDIAQECTVCGKPRTRRIRGYWEPLTPPPDPTPTDPPTWTPPGTRP